ncbi:hypothetical protein AL486_17780 [Pandoraea apista]|nr:hypothetical protein AL486_17780 [Pandoraea apista]
MQKYKQIADIKTNMPKSIYSLFVSNTLRATITTIAPQKTLEHRNAPPTISSKRIEATMRLTFIF